MTEQTKITLREALESLLNVENVDNIYLNYYDSTKQLFTATSITDGDKTTRQEKRTVLKVEDEN